MSEHTKGEVKVVGYHGYLRIETLSGIEVFRTDNITASGYANMHRVARLWNAANGISAVEAMAAIDYWKSLQSTPTKEMRKYLEYGAEMHGHLKRECMRCKRDAKTACPSHCRLKALLAKLDKGVK